MENILYHKLCQYNPYFKLLNTSINQENKSSDWDDTDMKLYIRTLKKIPREHRFHLVEILAKNKEWEKYYQATRKKL